MELLGAMLLVFGLLIAFGSVVALFGTDDPLFIMPAAIGWGMVLASIFVLSAVEQDEHREDCKQYAAGLRLQSDWNEDQGCLLILPDGRKIKDEHYKVGG